MTVFQLAPEYIALSDARVEPPWKQQSFLAEGTHSAQSGAGSSKRLKHQPDSLLNLPVGIEHHTGVGIIRIANRRPHHELPATGLIKNAALQTCPEYVQFCFAHRSL
jgi:hypothetical protein